MFVLTIDQESSRTAGDRVDDFLELLSDAVAAHADVLVRPFERTVGDEVQGLMSSADLAVELALVALRTGEWQVGIGAGRIDEPVPASTRAATGEAFLPAREAVERARSRSRLVPLAVSGADPAAARDAESVLRLSERSPAGARAPVGLRSTRSGRARRARARRTSPRGSASPSRRSANGSRPPCGPRSSRHARSPLHC